MARKVQNRKALREAYDAAEAAEQAEAELEDVEEEEEEGSEDEEGGAKKKKKAAKKAPAKRKKKEPVEVRKKIIWGICNHAMKVVAQFDYAQKKAAEKKLEELNKAGKTQHFLQKIKQEIDG